jgi:hypothetical protein
MFHGRAQLNREPAMSYKDHPDHDRTEMSKRKAEGANS